jgi:hypothetical protein
MACDRKVVRLLWPVVLLIVPVFWREICGADAVSPRSLAFSRLPADGVLFEISVHSAAYGRIEVCGAEAFK